VPIVHAPNRESARDAMPLLRTMDRDAFWNGFIDQVAVEDDGNVRFHPRIGDLVVELGRAEELDVRLDDQLRHLKTFYRALLDSGDLRQYGTLDLRYDGQLVASK
jgi:cell division protein FtsQ